MHVVITGATGAIGRQAVPRIIADGHTVVGLHRRPEGAEQLRRVGAEARRVDLFDRDAVAEAVRRADAVIHLATAIPPLARMSRRRHWAMNDRLRAEATEVLVDAAHRAGVPRVVLESITLTYQHDGSRWLSEESPVRPAFAPTESALTAERLVAGFTAGGGSGVTLRFAQLYGPGGASEELVAALRARRVPLVGPGQNFVSSVHVEDAGRAVAAALDAPAGTYNVADDEPLRAWQRLELQAAGVGAPTPRRVPAWLARALVGGAVNQLTVSQRVLNRRMREVTGWSPAYPSVRDGWPTVVAAASESGAARR
jgi:nucleoside-diphosphate-sugar epimerase